MDREKPPMRPRDAASLVIHRRVGKRVEVLMGRRSETARFKPGMYVFPGGGLERADHRVRTRSVLAPTIVERLAVAGSASRGHALALAAVRETWEEVGVMVGEPGDIGTNPSPSWQAFQARGIEPPLGRLSYLGRAITPSVQPIRFHARFFAVDAALAHGEPRPSGELHDVQWVPLADVQGLEVMAVTLLMLEALSRQLHARDTRAAFLCVPRGQRRVLWV
jgi:8-oxo-dGTP pyrophosphatase MutT (NUDIX family)